MTEEAYQDYCREMDEDFLKDLEQINKEKENTINGLRDIFAASVVSEVYKIYSKHDESEEKNHLAESVASQAYNIADAMIIERQKRFDARQRKV